MSLLYSAFSFATMLLLSTTPQPKRHVVSMKDFQFEPAIIRAAVGDTIVWQNHDIVPHTAHADDRSWDSGNIPAHGKQITVLRRKGEQEFTCLYHTNMKGKLVVS